MALGRRKAKPAAPARPGVPTLSRREKLGQVKQAFTLTRERDPKMLPLVLTAFLVTLAVFVLLGVLLHHPVYLTVIGVLVALLVTVVVFGKRVQKTAIGQVEGQPGAAAAVLSNMRGDWRVTPAVAFTREQDLVHRVLGRPGIVLVAEGSPQRTRSLIGAEKKKVARVVGETPVYAVTVGDGEGEVPLRQLEKHVLTLPRNIKPAQVNVLDRRLKALGAQGGAMPVPKGPMPTRMPRGKAR